MPTLKHIFRPSAANRAKGLTQVATLDRKVNYLSSEHDRADVILMDERGEEIDVEGMIQRLGGKDSKYSEILLAPSRLEIEAIEARNPSLSKEESAKKYAAAWAEKVNQDPKSIAIHFDDSGNWHAHVLIQFDEAHLGKRGGRDYSKLEGHKGPMQKAWNQVWNEGLPSARVKNWQKEREFQKLKRELLSLRMERSSLLKERNSQIKSCTSLESKAEVKSKFAQMERELARRIHGIETETIEARYEARGLGKSLERLVEEDQANARLKVAERQADERENDLKYARAKSTPRDLRKPIKEMTAAERLPIREEAFRREMEALSKRFEMESERLHNDNSLDKTQKKNEREHLENRAAEAFKSASLSFEAVKLRDREDDLRKAARSRKVLAAELPSAFSLLRSLQVQRHGLERQSLLASAKARGLQEPSKKDMERLGKRHVNERQKLNQDRAKAIGGRVEEKFKSVGRRAAKVGSRNLGKALKAGIKKIKEATKSNNRGPKALQDLEQGQDVALAGAGKAIQGAAQTALTAAKNLGIAALHQAKHAARAAAVTAQAAATAIVNPAAGLQIAKEGYSQVGKDALRDGTADAKKGGKETTKEAAKTARDSGQEVMAGLASMGMSAMPKEVEAAVKTTKAAALAAVQTAKNLLTVPFNPIGGTLGAVEAAAGGAIQTAKEATGMLRGTLPMPVDKVLGLASKIPIIGIIPKVAQLGAELAAGATKAVSVAKDFER